VIARAAIVRLEQTNARNCWPITVARSPKTIAFTTSTGPIQAASKVYGICRYLVGTGAYSLNNGMLLDELRIYNTVLTTSNIQTAAAGGVVVWPRPPRPAVAVAAAGAAPGMPQVLKPSIKPG